MDHIIVSTYEQLEETREELATKCYVLTARKSGETYLLESYHRPGAPEEKTEVLLMDHYDRQNLYNTILETHRELGAASTRPLIEYLKYKALEADFRQFMMGIGEWRRPEHTIAA